MASPGLARLEAEAVVEAAAGAGVAALARRPRGEVGAALDAGTQPALVLADHAAAAAGAEDAGVGGGDAGHLHLPPLLPAPAHVVLPGQLRQARPQQPGRGQQPRQQPGSGHGWRLQ